MTTIRDVAKLAGVSVATVSRVINQNGYVNKDTELKVKNSMELLNYKPNSLARALVSKKTDTIALIVPDITNPFFPELAKAVEETAQTLGYSVILSNSNISENNDLVESLRNRFIDGFICASNEISEEQILKFQKLGTPVVTIDRAISSNNVSSIQVDNYKGGIMAVEHLLSIGCKKIALLSGPFHLSTALGRYRGYVDALDQIDNFNPSLVVEGDFSIESGIKNTYLILDKHPDIDAIFATNDLMAVGALKALIRLGKKVPEDIALIGFDGIGICTAIEPEISTIAQPIFSIGSLAVKQLINQIKDNKVAEGIRETLDVQLVQRGTTKRKL
jgi:LacI family transcriptional regulator